MKDDTIEEKTQEGNVSAGREDTGTPEIEETAKRLMLPKWMTKEVTTRPSRTVVVMLLKRVLDRFIGLTHVSNTSVISLKNAIISMLLEHYLGFSRIRGQGYDGGSNMQGKFNIFQTLIMIETKSAYYIHYFAHQL